MTEPAVLTVPEVAKILRISEWSVGEMCRTGFLPRIPGLRRIRIPAVAVQALVQGAYIGTNVQSDGEAAGEKTPSRRRNRCTSQGSLAKASVGSSGSLARPIGPAPGDVVVRVVEGRSR